MSASRNIAIPKTEIVAFCLKWRVRELSLFGSVFRTLLAEADCDLKDQAAWRLSREWVALMEERFGQESAVLVWVCRQ